jgi:hypothetical protein
MVDGARGRASPLRDDTNASIIIIRNQRVAGGEIQALGPANYSGVIITQAISLTGIEGAGIDGAGFSITINAGPNDAINLSHLTVDGLTTASVGITLNSGGSLTISRCGRVARM